VHAVGAASSSRHSAWPASWKATTWRSWSLSVVEDCTPAMTRSMALSKSARETAWPLRRPQKIAASLQMLARSAPVRPAVCWATIERSTSSRSGLLAVWHAQDALAAPDVGRRDEDLAVEAAGAQQGRVELLEQVGGGHDDDAALGRRREAVHLDQQLVERLLAL
jgi:hypothetical protein